jgi:hypothetical protein
VTGGARPLYTRVKTAPGDPLHLFFPSIRSASSLLPLFQSPAGGTRFSPFSLCTRVRPATARPPAARGPGRIITYTPATEPGTW